MTFQNNPRSAGRDMVLGWSALGAAALAVFAWAACCVLPVALSIAGLSLAGTAIIAGQRGWVTLATVVVLAAGWWVVWRRGKACSVDANCPRPSRLVIGLLSMASILTLVAFAWQPVLERWLLAMLRSARG